MSQKINYYPKQILKTLSKDVPLPYPSSVYSQIQQLKHAIRLEDEVWTRLGLSLSAPQLGIPLRFFIISRIQNWNSPAIHRAFDTFVNPQIVWFDHETSDDWEGCLSIPQWECLVTRPNSIEVNYFDYTGNNKTAHFKGTYARIIQHEIDHLDGKLMTEKAKKFKPHKPLKQVS